MSDELAKHSPDELDPEIRGFYLAAMKRMDDAGVKYLVGGAYSLACHAGIVRHTKDFDVFIQPCDVERTVQAFKDAGYHTEFTFPHWLAKVYAEKNDAFVDIIFASGNGLCPVDEEWFAHAVDATVLDRPAKICPAEEVIWSKAFVMERERFDGADINHLLQSRAHNLDYERLIRRFGRHERILLAHLLMFGYVYPAEKEKVPREVIDRLFITVQKEPSSDEKVCRGTFISREQYLIDLRQRGYIDARLEPAGPMRPVDVAHWTAAIGTIK